MSYREPVWRTKPVLRWVHAVGLVALITGCHGKRSVSTETVHEVLAHMRHSAPKPLTPEELAATGSSAIQEGCAKEPFANARKGMIAGETRLHEDVFELRDRTSLVAIPFELNATLKLEELLRAEAASPESKKEQAGCLEGFADYLQTLTDPILERDRIQKAIDVSALNDANKQTEEQLEKKTAEAIQAPESSSPR